MSLQQKARKLNLISKRGLKRPICPDEGTPDRHLRPDSNGAESKDATSYLEERDQLIRSELAALLHVSTKEPVNNKLNLAMPTPAGVFAEVLQPGWKVPLLQKAEIIGLEGHGSGVTKVGISSKWSVVCGEDDIVL